jgi:hypothetical protein
MSEDIRKMIDKVKNFKQFINETSKSVITYNNDTVIKKFNDKFETHGKEQAAKQSAILMSQLIYNIEFKSERISHDKHILQLCNSAFQNE